MTKLLTSTAMLLALAAATSVTSASASELPACNSTTVVETLASTIRPSFIVDVEDYEKVGPAAKKRWCYTYFSSTRLANGGYRMGSPWQEAIYTIEWTNEAEGRFWLQIIEQVVHRKYGNNSDYDEIKLHEGKWISTHTPSALQQRQADPAAKEFKAGENIVLNRHQPACANAQDANTVNYYWLKNDPFLQKVMNNHKDDCSWLKAGQTYKVQETKKEGWMMYSCLLTEDGKPCLWLGRDERLLEPR